MIRFDLPTNYLVAFALGGAIGLLPSRVMARGTIATVVIVAIWVAGSIVQAHVPADALLDHALDTFKAYRALLIAGCTGWALAAVAARARSTT